MDQWVLVQRNERVVASNERFSVEVRMLTLALADVGMCKRGMPYPLKI